MTHVLKPMVDQLLAGDLKVAVPILDWLREYHDPRAARFNRIIGQYITKRRRAIVYAKNAEASLTESDREAEYDSDLFRAWKVLRQECEIMMFDVTSSDVIGEIRSAADELQAKIENWSAQSDQPF